MAGVVCACFFSFFSRREFRLVGVYTWESAGSGKAGRAREWNQIVEMNWCWREFEFEWNWVVVLWIEGRMLPYLKS